MKDVRPLSERFDLTYIRRPHLADRWTGMLSAVLALGAVAAIVGMGVIGDKRIYTAGTLTHSHAMFGDDCLKCHEPAGSGALAGFSLPVRDAKCLACHPAPLHNPHQSRFVGLPVQVGVSTVVMSSDCTQCHVEHRGADVRLAETGDQSCVQCHSDLQSRGWSRAAATAMPSLPGTAAGATSAVVNAVSSFATDHPEWGVLRESKRDGAALKFGHEKHMNPALKGGPLDCMSCHVRDAAGRYMQPITFEAHCRSCHEAELRTINVAEGFVPEVLTPHETVEDVLRTIDVRLAMLVAQHPEKFVVTGAPAPGDAATGTPVAEPAARPRGPRAAKAAPLTIPSFESVEARQAWIDERRMQAIARAAQGCVFCHVVDTAGAGDAPFSVRPTAVPPRWLTRSVFSHDSHAMVRCDECHAAGKSALTEDVLLPGIDSCRECHAPRTGVTGGAPHSCVTCHTYHMPAPQAPGRLTIDDLHPSR